MTCPKCTGLLIQEEVWEHGGQFQGWRCVQCGLRLDETIVQNRLTAPSEDDPADLDASASTYSVNLARPSGRQKRSARVF
ncbi:MAG: hypothetical protein ACREI2_05160 [Nitrospiraceae bacterium]